MAASAAFAHAVGSKSLFSQIDKARLYGFN
jgi:hypothetical protein